MQTVPFYHAIQALRERILDAAHNAKKDATYHLRITGGKSKVFLKVDHPSNAHETQILNTQSLNGIIDYQASELVVRVASGTPLIDLQAALAEQGQYLPFDAPTFGNPKNTTIGGAIAAGLAGPRRASYGSLRDFVLGVNLIDGQGRLLRFGGQVIKNVAGYDVSRLLCGSWGQWALITEVSLRTLPLPKADITVQLHMDGISAIRFVQEAIGKALPIAASSVTQGITHIRLSGNMAAVTEGKQTLTQSIHPQTLLELDPQEAMDYWRALKNHCPPVWQSTSPSQDNAEGLWRMTVPPMWSINPSNISVEPPKLLCLEWHGSLRWLRASWHWSEALEYMRALNKTTNHVGSMMYFGQSPAPSAASDKSSLLCNTSPLPILAHIPKPQHALLLKIKNVFDPHQLFV